MTIDQVVAKHLVDLKPKTEAAEIRGAKAVCTVDKYTQILFVAPFKGAKKAHGLISDSRKG
jgi:aromatic ring hydroxylase